LKFKEVLNIQGMTLGHRILQRDGLNPKPLLLKHPSPQKLGDRVQASLF
jgi:hypothetical protein